MVECYSLCEKNYRDNSENITPVCINTPSTLESLALRQLLHNANLEITRSFNFAAKGKKWKNLDIHLKLQLAHSAIDEW